MKLISINVAAKRTLSMLLVLVMVLGLSPALISADYEMTIEKKLS